MAILQRLLNRRSKTKPRNNEFSTAAGLLEGRANAIRYGLNTSASDPTAEVVESLATFVRAIGSASATADRVTRVIVWLTVVGVIVALTNAALVVVQILESNRAINEQNAIALNALVFHDPGNQQIMEAIERHKPILIDNHGHSTSTQLDGYLGDLETIESAYTKRQITEDELCDSYSVTINETFANPEIKKYLHDNSDYFSGAVELGDIVKKSKKDECH